MNYHSTIGIYYFDVFNNPQQDVPTALLKSGSMENAKRKGHQRATAHGYTSNGNWKHATENYATREYLTEDGARRLVVVERS